MFLTLTCVTANATVMAEAPEITQPQPKHHKKPHHKKSTMTCALPSTVLNHGLTNIVPQV